jgi:hypothetical protein
VLYLTCTIEREIALLPKDRAISSCAQSRKSSMTRFCSSPRERVAADPPGNADTEYFARSVGSSGAFPAAETLAAPAGAPNGPSRSF